VLFRSRRSRSRRSIVCRRPRTRFSFRTRAAATSTSAASGRRHWKPGQIAAGIEPLRHLYDPRHTYATFALRAGVSVFVVSRFMGSSIAMIDRHYGHLARDSRANTPSRSSMHSRSKEPWTLGGRRPQGPRSRLATGFRGRCGSVRGRRWTLGGRRRVKRSPTAATEGAD
jgi:hypothetical protein